MERRGFFSGLAAVGAGVFSLFFSTPKARASSQVLLQPPGPDSWDRPNQLPSFLLAAGDRGEVAHRIWLGYGLDKPNNYDTSAAFCQALLRDWEHNRPAYVWRTYGSARLEGRHVYVLPARFVIAHPPFLPDFPNGYYRIDPTMDVDDAAASIHPSVFIRVLPAQAVDVYPPPSPA